MEAIPVTVTIEPSDSGGEAIWVRSQDRTWWKWYGSRLDACIEAVQLGLVNRRESLGESRFSLSVNYSAKENAVADPDQLHRFGFGQPPI